MICIIPARGGSKRIKQKNIRPFGPTKRPIIEYAINTARTSGLFSEIIVSTDDWDIAGVSEAAGVGVHLREWNDPDGDVGTQEVAARVLDLIGCHDETPVCVLYATSPLITPNDLLFSLQRHKACGYFVMSVGTAPLRDAGAIYWGKAGDFIDRNPLITEYTGLYPLPESRVCDINTETDWQRAESLYLQMREEAA